MTDVHTQTPEATTTSLSSLCSKCGTIEKSGKISCCGRGGSWFKNCGGTGKKKLHHRWYEGIQACKVRTQSKAVVGQKSNSVQQKHTDSSQGTAMANYKEVIASTKMFAFTSVNASTSVSDTTSIVTSIYTPDNLLITTSARTLMTNSPSKFLMNSSTHTSASTATRGCVNVLKIIVHLNLLFIVLL